MASIPEPVVPDRPAKANPAAAADAEQHARKEIASLEASVARRHGTWSAGWPFQPVRWPAG